MNKKGEGKVREYCLVPPTGRVTTQHWFPAHHLTSVELGSDVPTQCMHCVCRNKYDIETFSQHQRPHTEIQSCHWLVAVF